jgi:hypothetical protein
MAVESERIAGDQPHEAAVGKDEEHADVEGLSESADGVDHLLEDAVVGVLLLLELSETDVLVAEGPNEAPSETGETEEDWREHVRVVVAELGDERRRGESTSSTGDFVEDVDKGIHATEALDITTDDVTRNDTTDQLNHTVSDARDDVHREETVKKKKR